jgi:Flp pilus assembly protein TadD
VSRAATLAPNASALSTYQVLAETEDKQVSLDHIDAEDFNQLQAPNGQPINMLGAGRLFPLIEEPGEAEAGQKYAQAIDQHFTELVSREPELASGHMILGSQFEQFRDFEDAIREYRDAETLEPDNPTIRLLTGLALLKHHKNDEAVAELREALRIAPSGLSQNLTLAQVYETIGRTPEAIEVLQEAVNLRPTNEIFSENLVTEFEQHRDFNAAIVELRRSLAADYATTQDEGKVVASRMGDESVLAQLLIKEKRFEEATAQYRFLIRVQPDNAGWHNDYGNFLFVTHKCDEALNEYQASLRLSPGSSIAYSNMAMCSTEKKDYEGAIAQLKHALEMSPEEPGAENNLAWLYCIAEDRKYRNPTEALRLAQLAVEAQPDNPSFLDTLAEAQLLNGNAGAALATETSALAGDPENEEFQTRLIRFREAAASSRKP